MKKSWKLSEKDKEEIKRLKATGWKNKDLAAKFEIHPKQVLYHCNPKYKETCARRGKRWAKNNPERVKATKHKYYTKRHDLYYPSVCISMMKKCLREGWLEKERIIKTIQEVEK